MNDPDRIEALEIKCAHLEHAVQELSDALPPAAGTRRSRGPQRNPRPPARSPRRGRGGRRPDGGGDTAALLMVGVRARPAAICRKTTYGSELSGGSIVQPDYEARRPHPSRFRHLVRPAGEQDADGARPAAGRTPARLRALPDRDGPRSALCRLQEADALSPAGPSRRRGRGARQIRERCARRRGERLVYSITAAGRRADEMLRATLRSYDGTPAELEVAVVFLAHVPAAEAATLLANGATRCSSAAPSSRANSASWRAVASGRIGAGFLAADHALSLMDAEIDWIDRVVAHLGVFSPRRACSASARKRCARTPAAAGSRATINQRRIRHENTASRSASRRVLFRLAHGHRFRRGRRPD